MSRARLSAGMGSKMGIESDADGPGSSGDAALATLRGAKPTPPPPGAAEATVVEGGVGCCGGGRGVVGPPMVAGRIAGAGAPGAAGPAGGRKMEASTLASGGSGESGTAGSR